MKLRTLASALRKEPLAVLVGEAAWRSIRSVRIAAFRLAGQRGDCPVRFHPIGYYQFDRQLVPVDVGTAILGFADAIVRGEFPLMGYGIARLGFPPDWQCDWVSGKGWSLEDSLTIQIVRHDGSDVKAPWELSRLQWSPVVAKAWMLTGDRKYRETLCSLLTDWIVCNPVGKGVNWTVAMEAAIRAISLCLTMELLWPFAKNEKPWLEQLSRSLWQHLRFIETHNEFSFLLRSNHYLSNIVGLTTLSAYLEGRGMKRRREKYAPAVQREVLLQTYPDGGDRESSTGYHVLVAQLALHSFVVQKRSGSSIAPEFEARLRSMFRWIAAVADDAWKLPHLGDCDNGRVELLVEDVVQPALAPTDRHSLKVGGLVGLASHLLESPLGGDGRDAIWFGGTTSAEANRPEQKRAVLLRESGIAVLRSQEASVVFCAMPNGLAGKGSHTHCDKLSFIFRLGVEELFCDSGSRCYTRSAELRNRDRSTGAHNTLMIDAAEQNVLPADPQWLFRCGNEASVSQMALRGDGELSVAASHQGYSRYGIEHQRTVQLRERALVVIDEVSGAGEHSLDLRFILGPEWSVSSEMMTGETVCCVIAGPRSLTLACEGGGRLVLSVGPTHISREYGNAFPVSSINIHTSAALPARVQTTVRWD